MDVVLTAWQFEISEPFFWYCWPEFRRGSPERYRQSLFTAIKIV